MLCVNNDKCLVQVIAKRMQAADDIIVWQLESWPAVQVPEFEWLWKIAQDLLPMSTLIVTLRDRKRATGAVM